jgi:osmotically inducible lipoprotein OsmB
MGHSYFRPIRNVFISTALAAALLLAGCSGQPLTTREKGTIAGGAIGLGTGAIVGSAVGAPGAGAAIGGVVGAGAGYAVGNSLQNSENRRRYAE